jgi:hypothetical protein
MCLVYVILAFFFVEAQAKSLLYTTTHKKTQEHNEFAGGMVCGH